jgi:NAD dependent epimerase/dehydratase family enzyme
MNINVIKITDFICNSKMGSKVKLIIEWNNIWKTKIIKKKTNFQKYNLQTLIKKLIKKDKI